MDGGDGDKIHGETSTRNTSNEGNNEETKTSSLLSDVKLNVDNTSENQDEDEKSKEIDVPLGAAEGGGDGIGADDKNKKRVADEMDDDSESEEEMVSSDEDNKNDTDKCSKKFNVVGSLKRFGNPPSSSSTVKRIVVSALDNVNNENREKELTFTDDSYAEHVTYNEKGIAIYTDPTTNVKYEFSSDKNQWVSLGADEKKSMDVGGGGVSTEVQTMDHNPYENEHYRWDTVQNKWIPKINDQLENEFYKWSIEEKKWIPKESVPSDDKIQYGYDKDGLHTYSDKDGTVFFWDVDKNAWFPKIDDDFMAQYQMNYGFVDNSSKSDDELMRPPSKIPSQTALSPSNSAAVAAARAAASFGDDDKMPAAIDSGGGKQKSKSEPPTWFEMPSDQNTKVYVSNLPLDITETEFEELMAKCGLIVRDPQTQKMKVKLYRDTNGEIKGDGLCNYIKVESVELALNLLDGSDVRGKKITVQRAKFEMRGEYNPTLKPKRRKKDKEKAKKMQEKLFDWRPDRMRGERARHERVVIIKNLFEPELFDNEVHLIIDYQKDLREECGKCGKVRKVMIYDRHPDGVAQIVMSDAEEADLVIQLMNRRFFGQRRLIAETWDGKTKYKIDETESEVKDRLSNWDKFLESEDTGEPTLEPTTSKSPKPTSSLDDEKVTDIQPVE